jgi:hypothetical protein
MLRDLDHEIVLGVADRGVRESQRGVYLGQLARRKFDVHDGTQHLNHATIRTRHDFSSIVGQSASAPETISISSFVIAACRVRLYCSVKRLIMSSELRVALSIAVMRAACSPAWLSSSAR